jgi:hypothetical protein
MLRIYLQRPRGLVRALLPGPPTFVSPSPHHVFVGNRRYRNINLFPIDYAFQPRLRDRLTLGGFTFPRKPWVFGEQDSRLFYRYSYRHSHFHIVQPSFRSTFNLPWNAPLPLTNGNTIRESAASVNSLVPLIFGADLLDQ